MAYGDLPLDARLKPNKGFEGGACNRRSCQAEPALWYNHGSHSWYCSDCAKDISYGVVNFNNWRLDFERLFPNRRYHSMFENREMITARQLHADEDMISRGECPPFEGFGGITSHGDAIIDDHIVDIKSVAGRKPTLVVFDEAHTLPEDIWFPPEPSVNIYQRERPSYARAFISALGSMLIDDDHHPRYFLHRKNTRLSQQPHIDPPKPLTKRQLRRQKGRK